MPRLSCRSAFLGLLLVSAIGCTEKPSALPEGFVGYTEERAAGARGSRGTVILATAGW